ncbi:hypothetical protein EDB85DRAFT_273669 [Lactarius pseudohatsudake]|nr:hypothetical protein EDB85DRAFT_273669 [Lactarius pseudohatsudake]
MLLRRAGRGRRTGVLTCESHFRWCRGSFSWRQRMLLRAKMRSKISSSASRASSDGSRSIARCRRQEAMKDVIVKIMVEVLGIFGIVTKEMKQGRTKRYLKKLIGRRDVEDALVRLDRLTQQEVQMAIVQVLKVAHDVKAGVQTVGEQVQGVDDKVNLAVEDGKVVKVTTMETRALLQKTANNIDAESRSWEPDTDKAPKVAVSARPIH